MEPTPQDQSDHLPPTARERVINAVTMLANKPGVPHYIPSGPEDIRYGQYTMSETKTLLVRIRYQKVETTVHKDERLYELIVFDVDRALNLSYASIALTLSDLDPTLLIVSDPVSYDDVGKQGVSPEEIEEICQELLDSSMIEETALSMSPWERGVAIEDAAEDPSTTQTPLWDDGQFA